LARRTWAALVREGRAAVEAEGNARWYLGDLAEEATSLGNPIEEYADAIGVPPDVLETYRLTSAAWEDRQRRSDVPWSIFRELAHKADRAAILDAFIDAVDTPTVKAFRAYIGKAPNNYAKPTRESLVRDVRAALADPEIAAEVMRDSEAAKAATRAVIEQRAERRAPGLSREEREHLAELDEKMHREAQRAFGAFQQELGRLGVLVADWPSLLRQVADQMAEVNACDTPWPEGWAEAVMTQVERIRIEAGVEEVRTFGGVL